MKKMFQILFVVCFVSTPTVALEKPTIPEVTQISSVELQKMINDHASVVIIDTRDAEDFAKGHVSGAINITSDKVNAKSLAKIAPDMKTKLIFYCEDNGGQSSGVAAAKAIGAGYSYVYHYINGYNEWSAFGYEAAKK